MGERWGLERSVVAYGFQYPTLSQNYSNSRLLQRTLSNDIIRTPCYQPTTVFRR